MIAVVGILLIAAQEPISEEASKRVTDQLERSKRTHPNPQLSDLFGIWLIDNELHPSSSITLSEERVIPANDDEKHALYQTDACCCNEGGSPIIGAVQMKMVIRGILAIASLKRMDTN